MKRILFITVWLFAVATALAQSNTDKVRQFERLMLEWKSTGYSTGSEKYNQLKSMMTEGCKMSERVAQAYINEYKASTFDIRANPWLQYIKENRISVSLRDLREKTGSDGRRIVYCWVKYSQPGIQDKEDFVGFTFDGGKIFYICNNDMERAIRIRDNKGKNVIDVKPSAPFSITSCSVHNWSSDAKTEYTPFNSNNTRILWSYVKFSVQRAGSYDILCKLFTPTTSYSETKSVQLSSGAQEMYLYGCGTDIPGNHPAGNYRYEFYYNGTLLYTYRFAVPQGQQPGGSGGSSGSVPFSITSCSVYNWSLDAKTKYMPFNSGNTRMLWSYVKFSVQRAGSYNILCKLFTPTTSYSATKTVELPSGEKSLYLYGCGTDTPGTHPAGNYRYEFYYNGTLLYTYRFSVPTGQQRMDGGSGIADGHQYVDLGLSSGTLWATCNVGAYSPEEYGDYFAWGEISTKSKYDWITYKYANGSSNKLTKYCNYSSYGNNGFSDSRTTLERFDDVAYQKWGSSWCIPTPRQFQELKEQCRWIWTTRNGKKGYDVKGPNGKSIFLPAAGDRKGLPLLDAGSYGHYWSTSLHDSNPCSGRYLLFGSDFVDPDYSYGRYLGHPVRPVRCK